jgi:spore germination protein KC
VEAPNVLSAETVASTFIGRRLTLVQNAAILIGLPLAKKGISPYLDEMARSRESRRTQLLLVCSPSAQAVIDQARPPLDTNPVAFLDDIRRLRQTEGWIPHLSLQYFFGALQGTTADPVAGYNALQPQAAGKGTPKEPPPPGGAPIGATGSTLPRTGQSTADVFGAVAFRRSRAVGVLTGQQTVVLNMLQGNFRRSVLTIPDPFDPRQYDNLIVTTNHGPSVRIDTRGRIPSIRVQVPLEAAVESIGSSVDYALNAPSTARLQAAADGVLRRQAQALVAEAQHTWRADIFGFGNTARRNFATDRALKAYHWLEVFPQARVRIRFNVQVVELGPQLAPPVPGKP